MGAPTKTVPVTLCPQCVARRERWANGLPFALLVLAAILKAKRDRP
jgi:hypothetical protein